MREQILADFACCESQHHRGGLRLRSDECPPVEPEERDQRREGDAFVAIDERVATRQAEGVGRSKNREVALAISVFVPRPVERRLQNANVPQSVFPAEKAEQFTVDVEQYV